MSWTYSGDPANSEKDAVRYLVQDTNVRDQLAADEDIAYELSVQGSVVATAVAVAETILADMVRRDRAAAEAYGSVVTRLRRRLAASASALAGGTSVTDKDAREGGDRVTPTFRRDVLSVAEGCDD